MKFSYSLLKKILPQLPAKDILTEALSGKAFEVESVSGDIIDIKLTANRWSDASSHLGMAREISAIFGLEIPDIQTLSSIKTKDKFPVMIEKDSGCRRYIGIQISLKKPGKTPDWMKKAIISAGMRPINCVVDVLNYTMIEVGQPLHAFDAERVSGGIVVRRAKRGEELTTIDEKGLSLSEEDLVIADRSEALALAGIKGGKRSEVTTGTRRVILEAANFDNSLIYRTARRIPLQTDASQRFGRNLSPELAEFGVKRAMDLLESLCGAEIISANDVYPEKQKIKTVNFDVKIFQKITGTSISEASANSILRRLGFKKKKGGTYEVPYWRMDVSVFEDLVEEVVRINGFDEIKSLAPSITIVPLHDDPIVSAVRKARFELSLLGYDEVYNYSFSDEGRVELLNPIAGDKKFLRTGLTKGLMRNIETNKRYFDRVNIFEIGNVFYGIGDERLMLGAAIYKKNDKEAFASLKGSFLAFADKFSGIGINFEEEGGEVVITVKGEKIGKMLVAEMGALAAMEINLRKLMQFSTDMKFKPLPEYPSIYRDLSFWVYGKTGVGEILSVIREAELLNLEEAEFIDLYDEGDKRGVTYRLTFRSRERTLSDEEADRETDRAIKKALELPEVETR